MTARTIIIIIAIGLLLVPLFAQDLTLRIVVHKDNPNLSMNRSTLKNIFMGKRSSWPDGSPITVVIQKQGPLHEHFIGVINAISTQQFASYWEKIVYTGTGNPPKAFNSDAEVRKFVSENAGAIGYISDQNLDDSVQKMTIK